MSSRAIKTLRLWYDTDAKSVPEIVRRELQTANILSIAVKGDYATVELAMSKGHKSTVLFQEAVSGVPLTVVNDHSALLPVWLEQLSGEKGLLHIHVDRHSDLGMPNLLLTEGRLIDRFSTNEVDPSMQESVVRAVDSTAIEIGSFLTVALVWLSTKTLVWLHPPAVKPVTRGIGLRLGWTGIDRLCTSHRRLKAESVLDGDFDVALHVSAEIEELKSIIAADNVCGIILDIDLDYFDGSHEELDQQERMPEGDYPARDWLWQQKSFLDALFDAIPAGRLRSVGVARSPGFCPPLVADALVELVLDRCRWCFRGRGVDNELRT